MLVIAHLPGVLKVEGKRKEADKEINERLLKVQKGEDPIIAWRKRKAVRIAN
jgi:hypothetical protein